MCRVETLVLATILLAKCSALHMYPEIFDPSRFLQRPLPAKAHNERSASGAKSIGVAEFGGGFKDGEVGFVRSSSESGKGGYRHRENYHKKDGDQYAHEKQAGFGESKSSGEEVGKEKRQEHGRVMVDVEHYRPEPTYEVIEELTDLENPNQHKKYGQSQKNKPKKPTGVKVPAEKKSSRQTAARSPKDRSSQKKNHNGYESIVYHENERDSSEHSYGKRKSVGKMPADRKPAKQIDAHDGFEAEEDETDDGDRAAETSSEREYDQEYDEEVSDGGEAGRESDFEDNYESMRFDPDFERSFGSDEHQEGEGEHGEKSSQGRADGRQDQDDYDYDQEVDRDEVDEAASEDKYHGDDDSEEDAEKDNDDRQHEEANEGDADHDDDDDDGHDY